jgi:hypothetical protein
MSPNGQFGHYLWTIWTLFVDNLDTICFFKTSIKSALRGLFHIPISFLNKYFYKKEKKIIEKKPLKLQIVTTFAQCEKRPL